MQPDRDLIDGFFLRQPERGLLGRRRIEFRILGDPIPQGSAHGRIVRTTDGREFAAVTHDNPNLKAWRLRVQTEAQRALQQHDGFCLLTGPVSLAVLFEIPRPKSKAKHVTAVVTRPDLDKCIRSICDALTKVIWKDDSQVIEIFARKRYAESTAPASAFVSVEG